MGDMQQHSASQGDSSPSSVIEVEDLVTHYGDRRILNGITMEVREGEIMVIMGGPDKHPPPSKYR